MNRMSFVTAAALALASLVLIAGCAGQPAPLAPVREIDGRTTVTTVLADFEGGVSSIGIEPIVSSWGDRVVATRPTLAFVPNASPDGGTAARFAFEASFDEPFAPGKRWDGSGVAFTARFELGRPTAGAEGLAVRLRTEGFTRLELYLVQEGVAGPRTYYLPLTLAEGAWRTLKVPFSAFAPTESAPPFDPAKPVALEAHLSFQDNWEAFHFRQGAGMGAVLLADDVGFWRSKQPVEATILETFDDERDLLPFSVVLYGSSLWVDYTKTDQGELKLNDAVRAQRLRVEKRSGGQAGQALAIDGRLEITPAIKAFHTAWQSLALFLKAPIAQPLAGPGAAARAISFWVRSDIVRGGSLEIQDEPNDRYYGASFEVGSGWTHVVIPFERLESKEGTLADATKVSALTRLELAFELPPEVVEAAAAKGVLEFVLQLDEFRLER
jgi:hypothetical protein